MNKSRSNLKKHITHMQTKNASTKYLASVEIVNSWESAIKKARKRIARLKADIVVFQEMKDSGEPWPVDESAALQPALQDSRGV